MPVHHLIAAALLLAALCGCATGPETARLQEVRAFAAESAKLNGYADLTQRFRDSYTRQKPYLSAAAEQRERVTDARRRAAYDDLIAIQKTVVLYMQTLGQLAGGEQFDLKPQLKAIGSGIKAWPDTGLSDRHVNAYVGVARLLARAISGTYQDRAVQTMVREGYEALQDLLDAMQALLRYYDKSNDNEQKIVLGMLEMEIPFADTPRDRLLAVLARAHQQAKAAEYRLIGLRHTLALNNVEAIARGHQALLQHLDQLDSPAARSALARSGSEVRATRELLATPAAPVTLPPAVAQPE